MDEYQAQDAVGLAALVRSGAASPDELLKAARARATAVNPSINAIVRDIDPPAVAGRADAPFRGVPFLLKDLHQDLAGHPTSSGSRSLAELPASETSAVTQRWLEAGLVVFGKTNTPEFGAKGITESHLFGPARNPWDVDHTPGGSSGGSAAAVAAGIVPCAGASDGGGSIRIPASACGLFGLKPSRGLVPAGPQLSEGLGGSASDGVISRSVRDTAAMLDVLVGPTAVSPYLVRTHDAGYEGEIGLPPGRLRVAVCTASQITPDPHVEALTAAHDAAELLSELGHDVVTLERAPVDDLALAEDFLTSWFVHCAFSMDEAKAATGSGDSGFEPDTRVMAALGRATDPVTLTRAVERRHEHVRRLATFHESYDLLLTPTTATPPPRVGAFEMPAAVQRAQRTLLSLRAAGLLRHTRIVDHMVAQNLGWVPYTQLANLTGRPAMSVPLHWTSDELPIGVQLVGRLGAEPQLLRLAGQLEEARPWALRRPPLAGSS